MVPYGFPEPDAIAVIDPSSKKPFTLYVRPRDPMMETWFGRRQGVEGAVKNFKADRSFSVDKFAADLPKLLDGKDKLYYRFSVDRVLDTRVLFTFRASGFAGLKRRILRIRSSTRRSSPAKCVCTNLTTRSK